MSKKIKETVNKTRIVSRYLWQGLTVKRPHMSYIGAWDETPNLGDKALIVAARLLFPQCGFIDYPYSRPEPFYLAAKNFRFIKYGLLAGGTLINRTPRALKMAAESFPLCKNSIIFGTGVANPSFWAARPHWENSIPQWKPLLERCSYIGVRGPMSAEVLTEAGIDNVEVAGDPILVLAEQWGPDRPYIDKSIGLSISHPGIDPHVDMWGTPEQLHDQYVKLAAIARKNGWKVRWLIADPREMDLVTKIAKLSGTSQEICNSFGDYKTYLDLVRPISVFVGMKLHSVALATCAYVPSIMAEYRPKCRDYMRSIGQDANTIRTDQFNADKVWQQVEHMNSERQRMSRSLYENIKPVHDKQKQKAHDLITTLENEQ